MTERRQAAGELPRPAPDASPFDTTGPLSGCAAGDQTQESAEDRCTELVRANGFLRAFGREVVALRSADDILGHFIRQVAAVTKPDAASATRRVEPGGTEFAFADSYIRETDAIVPAALTRWPTCRGTWSRRAWAATPTGGGWSGCRSTAC